MSEDFDITSVVPKAEGEAAAPPKIVSLFRRGEPADDSSVGRGEFAESDDSGEASEDDGEETAETAPAPKAKRTVLGNDTTPSERSREAAAVRKAREAAATKVPPPDDDDTDDPPPAAASGASAGGKSGEPAAETDAEFVASLRKREKEQQWREEAQSKARSEADAILANARAEAAKAVEDARRQGREEARKEVIERMRTDPGGALQEWQLPADKFLQDIALAHTPEGKVQRAIAQQQQEIAELKAQLNQRSKSETEAAQAQQSAVAAQRKAHVETAFLTAASETTAPGARLLFDDATLLGEAYKVASARSQRGESCADADIIAELERNAQVRLSTLRQKLGGGEGAAAPAGRATGPRTLSAATTGERRSSPKLTSEMSEDELERHEAEVVRAAREKFQKRKAKTA